MSRPTPQIVVVIPVFNRRRMVVDCLESVAAQTRMPDQVVLVDDGSTDDTGQVARDWVAKHDRSESWKVITEKENRGASAARNRGFDLHPDADLVGFLDSDDLWPPDFLERAEYALEDQPTSVAACADILLERRGRPDRVRNLSAMESDVATEIFRDAGICSAVLLRADAVRSAGGFPEAIPTAHDVPFFCAVSTRGDWRHLPGVPVRKRLAHEGADEDGRLSARYADRMHRWAEVYAGAIEEYGERLGLSPARRARMIAKRWARAGAALLEQGDTQLGRECIRTAIRWRPFALGLRVRLLRSFFG